MQMLLRSEGLEESSSAASVEKVNIFQTALGKLQRNERGMRFASAFP